MYNSDLYVVDRVEFRSFTGPNYNNYRIKDNKNKLCFTGKITTYIDGILNKEMSYGSLNNYNNIKYYLKYKDKIEQYSKILNDNNITSLFYIDDLCYDEKNNLNSLVVEIFISSENYETKMYEVYEKISNDINSTKNLRFIVVEVNDKLYSEISKSIENDKFSVYLEKLFSKEIEDKYSQEFYKNSSELVYLLNTNLDGVNSKLDLLFENFLNFDEFKSAIVRK